MDLYLPFDKTVTNAVTKVLCIIEKNTGLKVSYEKTNLFRIGSIADTDAKCYTTKMIKWSNEYINMLGIDLYNKTSDLCNNLCSILLKLQMVSAIWYYRTLTVIGKITVVNTLLASLYNYRMQVLTCTNDMLYEEFYNEVQEFIWKGARPKISLSILCKAKHNGGLGLVDLKARHQALLFKWIKIIHKDQKIGSLANFFLGNVNISSDLWTCNVKTTNDTALQISKLIPSIHVNSFWFHLLIEWWRYSYCDPQNLKNILAQNISINSNILINRKMIYLRDAYDRGLRKLRDLCSDQEPFQILAYLELKKRFNINIPWLLHMSILDAIPVYWKSVIKNDPGFDDNHQNCYDHLLSTKNVCKEVYAKLTHSVQPIITAINTWSKLLPNVHFEFDAFQRYFMNISKITNITKLRNFQFRLLHNKIFCNNILYYWGKKESQKCEFCTANYQNITHLMYVCPTVIKIWECLNEKLINLSLAQECKFNCANIIFNTIHNKPTHVVNFITLLLKFCIFRSKCNGTVPNFQEYFCELQLYHDIEFYNATKTSKILRHEEKWSVVDKFIK